MTTKYDNEPERGERQQAPHLRWAEEQLKHAQQCHEEGYNDAALDRAGEAVSHLRAYIDGAPLSDDV